MAEGVGFEPTEVLASTVFKTAAFDHSAIPPTINVDDEPLFLSSRFEMVNIFVLNYKWSSRELFHLMMNKRPLWRWQKAHGARLKA